MHNAAVSATNEHGAAAVATNDDDSGDDDETSDACGCNMPCRCACRHDTRYTPSVRVFPPPPPLCVAQPAMCPPRSRIGSKPDLIIFN